MHLAAARAKSAKQVQFAIDDFGSVVIALEWALGDGGAAVGVGRKIVAQGDIAGFAHNIQVVANNATRYFAH